MNDLSDDLGLLMGVAVAQRVVQLLGVFDPALAGAVLKATREMWAVLDGLPPGADIPRTLDEWLEAEAIA